MKIDRLIGILVVLQQNRKVTAPYLAEKFEVSRRTINRDIEDICRAGIPIVTTQGQSGGISLMDGFSVDTTLFTEDELQSIFVGLKTLDSVSTSPKSALLAQKFNAPSADSMRAVEKGSSEETSANDLISPYQEYQQLMYIVLLSF